MVTWIFLRVLPNLFKMMGLTYNDHICSSCVKGERGFGSQIPSSISRSHYKVQIFLFQWQSLSLSTCRSRRPRTASLMKSFGYVYIDNIHQTQKKTHLCWKDAFHRYYWYKVNDSLLFRYTILSTFILQQKSP